MFETFFSEMIETIAGEFSQTQKNFLRFTLRPLYQEKVSSLLAIIEQCDMNHSHMDEREVAKLKDELRRLFSLTPLYTTKSREEVTGILSQQERLKAKWRSLSLSKGIE
jgi:hypothetical protein